MPRRHPTEHWITWPALVELLELPAQQQPAFRCQLAALGLLEHGELDLCCPRVGAALGLTVSAQRQLVLEALAEERALSLRMADRRSRGY